MGILRDQNVYYKAYGFIIESEIPFLELQKIKLEEILNHINHVKIHYEDLSQLWENYQKENKKYIIKRDFVLFQVRDVGLFCVRNGDEIAVSPLANFNEDQIRLYLLGTCMGIIFIQNKRFALHGSVVSKDGLAYCFVGDSGAGKSTLAAEFISRGYKFVSDDVMLLDFTTEDKKPFVIPGYPQQKLWQESLIQLGMSPSDYKPIFNRISKYAIPMNTHFTNDPLPLAGIFELNPIDIDKIEIHSPESLEMLQTLYHHTFRQFIVSKLNLMDWHFTTSLEILKHIFIYKLKRPIHGFTVSKLADSILETIERENKHLRNSCIYC